MTKIIAVTNQKGGVGKTTTSINLSASLAHLDQRVLLIDLDPQGNATMGSGVDKQSCETTSNEVLLGDAKIEQVIRQTEAGYDIIASNGDLTVAEVKLLQMIARESRLKNALDSVKDNYDYIVIDCPPSLNTLTLNALVASHSVLIPMQCEYYALEGLTGLLFTVEQINESINPDLHLEGILRTMYDSRNRLTQEVSQQISNHFPGQVFDTVIPRNVRLAEAPSHGLPALLYDKNAAGAKAYLVLAAELMSREEKRSHVEKKINELANAEEVIVTEIPHEIENPS